MARGYQGQATEFNNIDGTLPDGRVRRNGVLISADDANRTVIDRARNQALERQTGANPDRQIGASRAPVMADAVEPSNAMGFTDPNRYAGNNRELNVQRAKADGQFDSMRTRFNVQNAGKNTGLVMDDQGNIMPRLPDVTVPASSPAPQGSPPSFTQFDKASGNGVPAAGSPYELTYQKPDGTFYGETKAGEGRTFKTQQEASNFSRGFGAPSTPAAPAPSVPVSPESTPAVAGVTSQGYVAPSPEMATMFDAASTTPEQAAARKRVMEAPTGRAAGSGFINPAIPAPAAPSPVSPASPIAAPVSSPTQQPSLDSPSPATRYYDANTGTWKVSDRAAGAGPGLQRIIGNVKQNVSNALGIKPAPAPVITAAPALAVPEAPTIYTGQAGQPVPKFISNPPPSPVMAAPAEIPPVITPAPLVPAPTPQNAVGGVSPVQAASIRKPKRLTSLSQLDAIPQNDSIDFPRFSSSGSRRPTARLS